MTCCGFDGTATVEVRSASGQKRSIPFVKGKPVAADAQVPLTFTGGNDVTIVSFGDEKRYEIHDALIAGG